MGHKHSKRSMDIRETSRKAEVEGFGNEGRVEKIVDGVLEKPAANGHVDNDMQNGGDISNQNNAAELVKNGEAVAVEKDETAENADESALSEMVNGRTEAVEKSGDGKKMDDAGERKKKEKVVKKKFSFRNFSFSRKEKRAAKEGDPKSPEGKESLPVESDGNKDAEKDESVNSPAEENAVEVSNAEETTEKTISPVSPMESLNPVQEATTIPEVVDSIAEEKVSKFPVIAEKMAASEDLPPPLPASPPPSEPVDVKPTEEAIKATSGIAEAFTEKPDEENSSLSNNIMEKFDSSGEILKDAQQIAIETGKHIEEKATNLLKTVEKRAEESMRTTGDLVEDAVESMGLGGKETLTGGEMKMTVEEEEVATAAGEAAIPKMEEKEESKVIAEEEGEAGVQMVPPVDNTNVDAIAVKLEETTVKGEESGAGESLADIPEDLAVAATAEATEASSNLPESMEASKTIPSPPVTPTAAATGE